MENSQTPLWLELKKEYIDDNFEQLLPYLKNNANKKDSFYATTIELLKDRVSSLIQEISTRPLQTEEEELKSERLFNVRLLAAWLLCAPAETDKHSAFCAMLGELRILVPKFSDQLMETEMKCLFHDGFLDCGFTWEDVMKVSIEIFAYKIIGNAKFAVPKSKFRWWNQYGSVCVNKDSICILSTCAEKADKTVLGYPVSISTDYGIKVVSAGKEKLKHTQKADVTAIHTFTNDFIAEMKRSGVTVPKIKRLLSYSNDEKVLVQVTQIVGDKIFVETLDRAYNKLSGPIEFHRPSLCYYYANTFHRYFKVGDVFYANVDDAWKQTFTIDKTFVEFIVSDCQSEYLGVPYPALLIDSSQPMYYVWLIGPGFPVYTKKGKTIFSKGDFALVQATKCASGKNNYGIINGEVIEDEADYFDEEIVRQECIEGFLETPPEDKSVSEEIPSFGIDSTIISLLVRHLYILQKQKLKPSDRYAILAVARILAETQYDLDAAQYIDFTSDFLRALVLFAKDEDMRNVKMTLPEVCRYSEPALIRMSIISLLQQWGKEGNELVLSQTIETFEQKAPIVARVAKIIQTSNNMREIVTDASMNVLKREVIKTLQLEIGDEGDLEADSGIYLGVESGSVEFKESVVFPPNNGMRPDETHQIRNVLRGVCAFLNTQTGGTLYLGVSDQGYVKGIQNDLDYLNISSLDTYMRVHIQDPAKALLGFDAIANIRMEPMYDNQVIAIHVAPCQHRIIKLDEKAYIRINAESREMPDYMEHEVLSKKVFTNKEKAANLSVLQQALMDKKQVIIRNYASSNSGAFSDRTVEAYKLAPDSNLVICLDLKDKACKTFKLSRIGYVEPLDTSWQFTNQHKNIKVDAFHMTGEKEIKCCLQLDMMARNLLLEEYPLAKDDLKKVDYKDEWILDTVVYNVAGIARFFIGLANCITILDGKELKEYVKDFTKVNLSEV